MTGVCIALAAVSLLAVAEAAGLLLVNAARVHWKTHDGTLERQVAFDEALLEQLRGSRRSPDVDDPTRRVS